VLGAVAHTCNLATQEAEIRRTAAWNQHGQIVCETLSWKTLHKIGLVRGGARWKPWVQAPVPQKKKKKQTLLKVAAQGEEKRPWWRLSSTEPRQTSWHPLLPPPTWAEGPGPTDQPRRPAHFILKSKRNRSGPNSPSRREERGLASFLIKQAVCKTNAIDKGSSSQCGQESQPKNFNLTQQG
jgi:hypothetical protein